jgi:hypothetical protein
VIVDEPGVRWIRSSFAGNGQERWAPWTGPLDVTQDTAYLQWL